MSATVNKTKSGKPISKKLTVHNSMPKCDLIRLDAAESCKIEELLREKFLRTFPLKPKIKWGEILKEKLPRKLKKEKIRQLKDSDVQKQIAEKEIKVEDQKYFVLGFNKVVKSVQSGLVSSVIVSASLPGKLADIVARLCDIKKVPLVGLNNLEQFTLSCLGFSCSVMAFTSSTDDSVSQIVDIIVSLSGVSSREESVAEEGKVTENLKSVKNSPPKSTPFVPKPRNLLLKRTSKTERVFTPGRSDDDSDSDSSSSPPAPKRQKKLKTSSSEVKSHYQPTQM